MKARQVLIAKFEEAEERGDIEEMVNVTFDEVNRRDRYKELIAAEKKHVSETLNRHGKKADGKVFKYSAGTHWGILAMFRQIGAKIELSSINAALVLRIHKQRIKNLERRLEALESQAEHLKNFGYVGTWQKGAVHHHGHLVTDGGGLWHCMRDNAKSRPGTNGDDWRLCVKRGAMT